MICSCAGAGQHYDFVSRTQPSNSADQHTLHRSTGSGISDRALHCSIHFIRNHEKRKSADSFLSTASTGQHLESSSFQADSAGS